MSNLPYGLVVIGIIVAFFVIPSILFFRLSKTKSPLRLGLLLCVIHFSLVALMEIYLYLSKAAPFRGLIFIYIDAPSSLLINMLGVQFNLFENWNAFGIFGIFGSAQYFLIGTGIGWLCKKLTRR